MLKRLRIAHNRKQAMRDIHYLILLLISIFIFFVLIVFYFSISVSKLSENNKELTQELSILGFKFKELDKRFHELIGESQ
ncbi:hypothetical protein ES703_110303 [subsurface metagenome]